MDQVISDQVGNLGLHEEMGNRPDGSKRFTAKTLGPITAELDIVAGLVGERPTVMLVTSTKWAGLVRELSLMAKEKLNPENFTCFKIRNLLIVNDGSEDEERINRLNAPEARACDFQNKRRRLISGRNG
jgi:hypothetical protein